MALSRASVVLIAVRADGLGVPIVGDEKKASARGRQGAERRHPGLGRLIVVLSDEAAVGHDEVVGFLDGNTDAFAQMRHGGGVRGLETSAENPRRPEPRIHGDVGDEIGAGEPSHGERFLVDGISLDEKVSRVGMGHEGGAVENAGAFLAQEARADGFAAARGAPP